MKQLRITMLVAAVVGMLLAMLSAPALADTLKAMLDSFQEAPSTLSTTGRGEFRADIDEDDETIDFELSYEDLEGGNPTAAHIHLGRPGIAGGIIAFLCGGGGKPTCPSSGGTVSGTIVPADVIGPAGQGIAGGEFEEVVRAIRAGATYVNVHNETYPSGEIRGQLGKGKKGR